MATATGQSPPPQGYAPQYQAPAYQYGAGQPQQQPSWQQQPPPFQQQAQQQQPPQQQQQIIYAVQQPDGSVVHLTHEQVLMLQAAQQQTAQQQQQEAEKAKKKKEAGPSGLAYVLILALIQIGLTAALVNFATRGYGDDETLAKYATVLAIACVTTILPCVADGALKRPSATPIHVVYGLVTVFWIVSLGLLCSTPFVVYASYFTRRSLPTLERRKGGKGGGGGGIGGAAVDLASLTKNLTYVALAVACIVILVTAIGWIMEVKKFNKKKKAGLLGADGQTVGVAAPQNGATTAETKPPA